MSICKRFTSLYFGNFLLHLMKNSTLKIYNNRITYSILCEIKIFRYFLDTLTVEVIFSIFNGMIKSVPVILVFD